MKIDVLPGKLDVTIATIEERGNDIEKKQFKEIQTGHLEDESHQPQSNPFSALTTLIGREDAVASVCSLLKCPEIRLLTLTGAGGIGKTRLGLQVANELWNDFTDGIFFIPLAAIHDHNEIIATIAHTLGLRDSGHHSLFEHLKTFLYPKCLILLLDNFEHVLAAAPLLTELLLACPLLKLLITSRSLLHVQGEYEFSVPPLELPDLDQLLAEDILKDVKNSPAVMLFVQRARAIKPDFKLTTENAQAVAKICIQLDGLPLAIELAAARIKLLPPQALLSRLSHSLTVLTGGGQDLPNRQKTLRNTVAWSYDLLSTDEQILLRRLAVFVGSWQFEAADRICSMVGGLALSVLDGITQLLDQSMLQRIDQEEQEPRLILLETIREFAMEELIASGELAVVQQAHAAYYSQVAERAAPELHRRNQLFWLVRLEQERANLRASLSYLQTYGEWLKLAYLVVTLSWFWYIRGLLNEGQLWTELVLADSTYVLPDAVRGKVIAAAGMFASFQGQKERAFVHCQESLPLCKACGNIRSASASAYTLVHGLLSMGDNMAARSMAEDMLAFTRSAGDRWAEGTVYCMLGSVTLYEKNYAQSCQLHERGIAIFQGEGDLCMQGITSMKLANVYIERGEEERAQMLIQQGIEMLCKVGATWSLGCYFTFWGQIALKGGRRPRAHFLLQEALAHQQQMGDQQGQITTYALLAQAAAQRRDYAAACALAEKSILLASKLKDRLSPITCLEELASTLVELGEGVWAAQLWGTIEQLYQLADIEVSPFVRESRKPLVKMVRDHIGEQMFTSAWERGETLTPLQALIKPGYATCAQLSLPPADIRSSPINILTTRERDVLKSLSLGLTNSQIAERLTITRTTVNSYLRSIYSKLGVKSRTAAVRYGLDHKLIE